MAERSRWPGQYRSLYPWGTTLDCRPLMLCQPGPLTILLVGVEVVGGSSPRQWSKVSFTCYPLMVKVRIWGRKADPRSVVHSCLQHSTLQHSCHQYYSGAWMNRGLGIMKMEEGKLFWTFMAPHLGYWIAAPMPSIKGMYCMIGSSFPNQQNICYPSELLKTSNLKTHLCLLYYFIIVLILGPECNSTISRYIELYIIYSWW